MLLISEVVNGRVPCLVGVYKNVAGISIVQHVVTLVVSEVVNGRVPCLVGVHKNVAGISIVQHVVTLVVSEVVYSTNSALKKQIKWRICVASICLFSLFKNN